MKTKSLLWIALVIVVIVAGAVWYHAAYHHEPETLLLPSDYQDASYTIDGASTTLVNGYASTTVAPGSASMEVTQVFGNAATGTLGNSSSDVAFILTQTGGGSGTFYYIVAAIKVQDGYVGTNAILLGDRIAPQSTEIENGEIVVNYADRKPNEPMTAQPSVGVTRYFRVDANTFTLVEVTN